MCASNRSATARATFRISTSTVFEHLKVVDYGDADIPPETSYEGTVEKILEAQEATLRKVNDALDVGAIPIVIGQNSPCGSYAVGKPVADRTKGPVGMVSLDTHWGRLAL